MAQNYICVYLHRCITNDNPNGSKHFEVIVTKTLQDVCSHNLVTKSCIHIHKHTYKNAKKYHHWNFDNQIEFVENFDVKRSDVSPCSHQNVEKCKLGPGVVDKTITESLQWHSKHTNCIIYNDGHSVYLQVIIPDTWKQQLKTWFKFLFNYSMSFL